MDGAGRARHAQRAEGKNSDEAVLELSSFLPATRVVDFKGSIRRALGVDP